MKAIMGFAAVVVLVGLTIATANAFIMIDEGIRSSGSQKVENTEVVYGHRVTSSGQFVLVTHR